MPQRRSELLDAPTGGSSSSTPRSNHGSNSNSNSGSRLGLGSSFVLGAGAGEVGGGCAAPCRVSSASLASEVRAAAFDAVRGAISSAAAGDEEGDDDGTRSNEEDEEQRERGECKAELAIVLRGAAGEQSSAGAEALLWEALLVLALPESRAALMNRGTGRGGGGGGDDEAAAAAAADAAAGGVAAARAALMEAAGRKVLG